MSNTTSAWVRWPGYIAIFLLAMLPLAVMMVRSGNWQQGLVIYALTCLLSLLVLTFMAVQTLLPRLRDDRVTILKRALPALPGALLLLLALQGRDVPPIHNITTDLQDPPGFELAPTLRGENSNPLELSEEDIALHRAAYPDLQTLRSPRDYTSSYTRALAKARDLGWEITREDVNAGFIEAVDTTSIMRFKDDIVIRIRTNADGTVIDLRSVSRVGVSDLGANSRRISEFLAAFAG